MAEPKEAESRPQEQKLIKSCRASIAPGLSRVYKTACILSLNLAKVDQEARLFQVKGRSKGWSVDSFLKDQSPNVSRNVSSANINTLRF